MSVATLWAMAPLVLLAGGMMGLGLTTIRAAGATLALLLLLTALSPAGTPPVAVVWVDALPDAVLLTLTVVYTLLFGLLLYRLVEASGVLETLLRALGALGRGPLERLMWVLLVFGPLFESISGFGLAIVIVLPMLTALGYSPFRAMVLSLISGLAVPWGALGIGMTLGATMVSMPLATVGAATAVLAAPGYLVFWGTALGLARLGEGVRGGGALRGLLAVAVFSAGVWVSNRWGSPELGGVTGPLALAVWLYATGGGLQRDGERALPSPGTVLRAASPYLLLVALLATSRFVAPLQAWLTSHLVLALPGGSFGLPLLYNPGFSLALACLAALPLFGPTGGRRAALAASLRQWSRAALGVLLLVLVARVMFEAGMIRALAQAGGNLPAWLGAPVMAGIAGLGGFLTGSVAGANALFVNFQVAMAQRLALPELWVVAVQQMVAAGFTTFSPARIVFASSLTGQAHAEGAAMRRMLPVAAGLVLVGALALWP